MRIACVLIPRFALAAELSARPELRRCPVILGGTPHERTVVVECSPEAERVGVQRGMPLREALSRCHDGVFLDAHPALYADMFERMLSALEHAGQTHLQIYSQKGVQEIVMIPGGPEVPPFDRGPAAGRRVGEEVEGDAAQEDEVLGRVALADAVLV